MNIYLFTTLLFLLYHDNLFVQCQRQSSKKRQTASSSSPSSSDSSSDRVRRGAASASGGGGGGGTTTAEYEMDFLGETDITARDSLICPTFCPHRNYLTEEAVFHYWSGEMKLASACACHALKKNFQDQLARAILISLRSSPMIEKEDLPDQTLPLLNPQRYALSWEILGPINVGKLELDGDPTFDSMEFRKKFHGDLGRYLLAMRKNVTVGSDLVPQGEIHWQKATMQQNGQVDVHFPISWNDLVQGLSTLAVYELQGWARATHYIAKSGVYLIDCQGTHTVYLHNDDQTRLFVGDVYHARHVRATMELKAGLLGVFLPLRVSLQTAFRCEVQPAPEAVVAYTTDEVPYIVELPSSSPLGGGGGGGMGYLLSGVFAVRIYNPFPQAITLEYAVEKPFGIEGDWIVREAVVWEEEVVEGLAPRHTSIAPGQILSLPLTLIQTSSSSSSLPPRLPCRSEKITFRLTFHPSKGPSSQVNVEVGCRRLGQAWPFTFVDHDASVAQAALLLPIEVASPPITAEKVRRLTEEAASITTQGSGATGGGGEKKGGKARGSRSRTAAPASSPSATSTLDTSSSLSATTASNTTTSSSSYPLAISLHGSGISALSHAEAHKVMLPGSQDYTFGLLGYYLLAPSRFGAHNWESTGYLTAYHSMITLPRLLGKAAQITDLALPRVDADGGRGLVSGHSMGGHGAWLLATHHPGAFTCAAPLGSWIKKEEYGQGNAFYTLDISSSYSTPRLRQLLAMGMVENHVDQLVANLQGGVDVFQRVGSHDLSTHPWYSRRMHRLLTSQGVSSRLEEVVAKQHWWWDTVSPNDGGVVNDATMRLFYASCLAKTMTPNTTTSTGGSDSDNGSGSGSGSGGDKGSGRCGERSMTIVTYNPAMHQGLCGNRILQQHHVLDLSSLNIALTRKAAGGEVVCVVKTVNVRRLVLNRVRGSICANATHLKVNNNPLLLLLPFPAHEEQGSSSKGGVEVCIRSSDSRGEICPGPINPLAEKMLTTSGPLRHVAHRPVVIVYGTPSQLPLRRAMRDLAIYLANSYYAAHHSYVPVFSDIDFRMSTFQKRPLLPNLILIGDPQTNRMWKWMQNDSSISPLTYRLPADLVMHGGYRERGQQQQQEEEEEEEEEEKTGFSLANETFSRADHGLVFTFPIHRPPSSSSSSSSSHASYDSVAMGVGLHGNSPRAYLHLSRLLWPVIPPMVRPPFSLYLPDYLVVDEEVWAKGPGGLQLAGYWDSDWQIDERTAYYRPS